jgi:hypothetical protein
MKHLKNFNQLNEGHITLTSDEHKSVERVMKKLPQLMNGKLKILSVKDGGMVMKFKDIKNLIDTKSSDIVFVDSIDYVTATGVKSKVSIYIVNDTSDYKAEYLMGDSKDSEDNIILINQNPYNSDSLSIQDLRVSLIHELIHAKDPKINQLYTDKFSKNTFKKNYYKRRHEFEAFTGQLLNVISNSTYKFLKEGWSSKDLKEIFDDILEHFKDSRIDFINSFKKQNPDFMKTITTFRKLVGRNIAETDDSRIPEIDKFGERTNLKPDTLMFLNREWDKNKKISSEKNIEDLSKVAYDSFVSSTDQIKRQNSDYSEFLKDLYKEIKKQVDFVNSKRKEKIELNYKTISDWMNVCKNVSFMSRKTNLK